MSCDVVAALTRSAARRRSDFASSKVIELSMPNTVESCDIAGVAGGDDIAMASPHCVLCHVVIQWFVDRQKLDQEKNLGYAKGHDKRVGCPTGRRKSPDAKRNLFAPTTVYTLKAGTRVKPEV